MADQFDIDEALRYLAGCRGSDLHLSAGSVPVIRIDGDLVDLPGDFERFTPGVLSDVLMPILTED